MTTMARRRRASVGAEAMDFCEPCGWRLRLGARFCDGCGVRLHSAIEQMQCRYATVMFVDVVGSMQLASALGPERYWELLVEVVHRCVAVVQRHGGSMDRFTGDGVMAVFGGPVTLEEQAFRACTAALDVHAEVGRIAAAVELGDGIALRLRVGLNSGHVSFGRLGSAAVGYAAIGEQVGFAQRMESVAPSGGVMLSESTARLVDGVAVLGLREWVRIKGVETPVPAHRLLAVELAGSRRAAS